MGLRVMAEETSSKASIQDILKTVEQGREQQGQPSTDTALVQYRIMQEKHRLLSAIFIAVVTVVCLGLVLGFMARSNTFTATNIVNASGLVLVIQAILFVAVCSSTSEQLTSAIGAFGAIAGYLFGRATRIAPDQAKKE
jgi:membrane protease YdiL (CAAX protease family)